MVIVDWTEPRLWKVDDYMLAEEWAAHLEQDLDHEVLILRVGLKCKYHDAEIKEMLRVYDEENPSDDDDWDVIAGDGTSDD